MIDYMVMAESGQQHLEAATLRVHILKDDACRRWDEYVHKHPEATFFHRSGWREVIEQVLRHRTYYMYAEIRGDIQGVLPLAHINSHLFANALISTPFCVSGGVVASNAAAAQALEGAAYELARKLQVDYLELRNRAPRHPDWLRKDDFYFTFSKTLHQDAARDLQEIPRKQRAMIRKAEAAGLRSSIDAEINNFYTVYTSSMRRLGTPPFAFAYFHTLKHIFGEDCEILTVTRANQVIAGVMSFYFRDRVLPYYAGADRSARQDRAYDFMYWELMQRARERGVRVFDFGRSKRGSGAYEYKRHWGLEPQALHYEYRLIRAKAPPELHPYNAKYRFMIRVWKCLPLAVTRLLGPYIVRNIG